MKLRTIILLTCLAIGLITVINTSCNKGGLTQNHNELVFSAGAHASGEIVGDFVFNYEGRYNQYEDDSIYFSAAQNGNPMYILKVYIDLYKLNDSSYVNLPKTFSCDINDPDAIGRVEFVLYGDENEIYKSQTGTLTIFRLENMLNAYFDVVTMDDENGNTVNLSGSFEAWWGI